jgi:ABC-2 type transport system permease protein
VLFQNQEAQSEILHTRVICLVAVGIGALLLQPPLQAALFGTSAGGFSQYLTSVSVPFYLLFLVYFLMGFFLYATIYAGLGALVKRQDEVQSAVVIPMLLLISGYVMIYLAVYFLNATWVKVLSFIPFWTPTLMLVRIALGSVAWWDIALMLVTICVYAWFSVRIYRFGVLMYGQKPGLGQTPTHMIGDTFCKYPLQEKREFDSQSVFCHALRQPCW